MDEDVIAAGQRIRRIDRQKIPLGIRLLERVGLCGCYQGKSHKLLVYFLTFFSYTAYYIARKPFSVVKVVLCPECVSEGNSTYVQNYSNASSDSSPRGWPPFEGDYARTLLGSLDYSWLFAYAIALYFSGWVGDRVNLRYFLTFGTIGSGISTGLLGVAYFANIHHLSYFIVVQILGGIMQSTGWPSLLAVMSHWFGKQRRGLFLGVWSVCVPLGSILGTIIASFWADDINSQPPWGWALVVPALITIGYGVITFLFLTTDPEHVGLPPPVHHLSDKNHLSKPGGVANPLFENGELINSDNNLKDSEKAAVQMSEAACKKEATSRLGGPVLISHPNQATESSELQSDEVDRTVVHKEHAADDASSGIKQAEKGSDHMSNHPDHWKMKSLPTAVGFFRAFLIPGVVEYSLALFFIKLVVITFFFWLPFYVSLTQPQLKAKEADWLATVFDVGRIIGAIAIGITSDILHGRAIACVGMLILEVPTLFLLRSIGHVHLAVYIGLLILCGIFMNGPYALIATAVSSDLGTHKSLKDNQKAKATVAAIIDGTGSIGGAVGPLLIGLITDTYGWTSAFYVLMASCFLAALLLMRLVVVDTKRWMRTWKHRKLTYRDKEKEEQKLPELLDMYFKETQV